MAMRLSLAGRLILKGSIRRIDYPFLRARSITTSEPTEAPRSGFLSLRRLTAVGLVSASILGASIFAYDARVGKAAAAGSPARIRTQSNSDVSLQRSPTPLSELVRTYVVFAFCSVPQLVDWSPTVLAALSAVPGLRQVTEAVVRATFFKHFVGGDTAEDALPLIEALRAQNTGCLFAYSVEVDEAEASGHSKEKQHGAQKVAAHKQVVQETLHCIDVAADFEDRHTKGAMGRRTWVAIKLSAMVPDAEILRRFSKYLVHNRPPVNPPVAFPGCPLPTDLDVLSRPTKAAEQLTDTDIRALRELREDLVSLCTRAKERGVRLIFDAEYSWYEPAIDAFTLEMMRRFNELPPPPRRPWFGVARTTEQETKMVQPLVYATYQAYLRRTPEYLAQSMRAARKEGYSLGVKLVRGAYHPHELIAHPATTATADASLASPTTSTSLSISPDPVPPVWTTKEDTDARYNACVRTLISAVRQDVESRKGGPPSIGVLFGTHNRESAGLIVEELVKQGLATVEDGGVVSVGDEAAERVTMGQLYGMSAALTSHLVGRIRSSSPFVIKYIPYGQLSEVSVSAAFARTPIYPSTCRL
ncbi:FAD-linked oxidoreductase [Pilatotrama ljubarskyi]|nr:FAD-linked oxidoreductase [Pilatotrama ljubarskyi]